MKKVIKIIQFTDGYDWYKDKVGEQYEFMFVDEPTGDYVVTLNNSQETLGSVKVEDCEVFEVADDVIIRDFEHIPTEIEILNENLNKKDNEILELKLKMAEVSEEKDAEMLDLKLAIAEMVEGGVY